MGNQKGGAKGEGRDQLERGVSEQAVKAGSQGRDPMKANCDETQV